MKGRLVAVTFIFVLLGFGVVAFQASYSDAGIQSGATSVVNESVTVNEGNLTTFPQSNDDNLVYASQRDVTVKNATINVTDRGNWTWNRHNGTLTWNDSTALVNGSTAFVIFDIGEPTQEQELNRKLATWPIRVLGDEWLQIAVIILALSALAIATRRAG